MVKQLCIDTDNALTIPGRRGTVFSSLKQSRYSTPGRVAFFVPATLQLHAARRKATYQLFDHKIIKEATLGEKKSKYISKQRSNNSI